MDAGLTFGKKHGERRLRIYGPFQIGPQQGRQAWICAKGLWELEWKQVHRQSSVRQPFRTLAESIVAVGARV